MLGDIELETLIRCPACKARHSVPMPTDRCIIYWDCPDCGNRLEKTADTCCVYCAHGTVPCPPQQACQGGNCCSG